MKTLVADSGSTKTRWALAGGDNPTAITLGLNPLLTPEADFHAAVRQMLADLPGAAGVGEVWFYGAGCGTEEMQSRVASWLGDDLPDATVHVAGDLLGACRATCGHSAGLVGVLGTGSNLCHYDGTRIDQQTVLEGENAKLPALSGGVYTYTPADALSRSQSIVGLTSIFW